MKKYLQFFTSALLLAGCATAQNDNIINQKLDSKKDKEIVLVKVINDSRCPQGVQCIWAGEITFEAAAFENGKLIEQTQLTITPNKEKQVIEWFVKHLPESKTPLKEIGISPYPKQDQQIDPKDYYIQLIY
ncbi:lipoprotein [Flavobacterium sp. GCM10027622]|uniref:lipoprotein n=1 Tax=unclassified Flavobacterium TaxID=196869 RepID=UPI00360C71EC